MWYTKLNLTRSGRRSFENLLLIVDTEPSVMSLPRLYSHSLFLQRVFRVSWGWVTLSRPVATFTIMLCHCKDRQKVLLASAVTWAPCTELQIEMWNVDQGWQHRRRSLQGFCFQHRVVSVCGGTVGKLTTAQVMTTTSTYWNTTAENIERQLSLCDCACSWHKPMAAAEDLHWKSIAGVIPMHVRTCARLRTVTSSDTLVRRKSSMNTGNG